MSFCVSRIVPDDEPCISPQSEEICELLTNAGIEQTLIDSIMELVSQLESMAIPSECPLCAKRANEAEREAERLGAEWQEQPLPERSAQDAILVRCAANRIAQLEKELEARRRIGGLLSNCAYNLAQSDKQDANLRETLDSLRRQWDAVVPD